MFDSFRRWGYERISVYLEQHFFQILNGVVSICRTSIHTVYFCVLGMCFMHRKHYKHDLINFWKNVEEGIRQFWASISNIKNVKKSKSKESNIDLEGKWIIVDFRTYFNLGNLSDFAKKVGFREIDEETLRNVVNYRLTVINKIFRFPPYLDPFLQ